NFGKIIASLEERGQLENTIILYFTDNGPNGNRFNGGMRGRKGSVYEGGTRVPLWLSWPKVLDGNRDISDLSAHIDILPTLGGLLGLDYKGGMPLDGKNFSPVLRNEIETIGERNFFTQFNSGKDQLYPGAINTGRYKLVVNRQNISELYDLKNDPGESTDLKDSLSAIAEGLIEQYLKAFEGMKPAEYLSPLIPIGYSESPIVQLPAPEAKLTGNAAFKGGFGWANDYIINWSINDDRATWSIDVKEPGDYQVEILYNANQDINAGTFELQVNQEMIANDFELPTFDGSNFENSVDRVKRGEVYEFNWKKVEIENVELIEGKQEISIQLMENPRAIVKIKGLMIKRVSSH
ncbi:MAG: sulfatase/phosphatase domain-containing protein, partial [Bacteroidota bacterium]